MVLLRVYMMKKSNEVEDEIWDNVAHVMKIPKGYILPEKILPELDILDYIDTVNKLVLRYGVEFDVYAWNEIKKVLTKL